LRAFTVVCQVVNTGSSSSIENQMGVLCGRPSGRTVDNTAVWGVAIKKRCISSEVIFSIRGFPFVYAGECTIFQIIPIIKQHLPASNCSWRGLRKNRSRKFTKPKQTDYQFLTVVDLCMTGFLRDHHSRGYGFVGGFDRFTNSKMI
jgi:hypothetical protein